MTYLIFDKSRASEKDCQLSLLEVEFKQAENKITCLVTLAFYLHFSSDLSHM